MTRARTAGALTVSVVLASGCGLIQHSASLTFQVGNVECLPAKTANPLSQVCSFLAFYGNISKHPIQVEPATTMVLDKTGKTFLPTADDAAGTFLLKPGQQQQVSWSVALPKNTRPTKVQWHGSAVDVQFQVPGAIGPSDSAAPASAAPSATPSVAAPSSAAPSTVVAPTTPVPTSGAPTTTTSAPKTTKPPVKPTKSTPKPTKTSPAPTTTPVQTTTPAPRTTPAPTHTRHTNPPVPHTPTPTTANSSNPGGGIGHIG